MRAIFQKKIEKRAKKMIRAKKGKIFEKLGKSVQKFKIF